MCCRPTNNSSPAAVGNSLRSMRNRRQPHRTPAQRARTCGSRRRTCKSLINVQKGSESHQSSGERTPTRPRDTAAPPQTGSAGRRAPGTPTRAAQGGDARARAPVFPRALLCTLTARRAPVRKVAGRRPAPCALRPTRLRPPSLQNTRSPRGLLFPFISDYLQRQTFTR